MAYLALYRKYRPAGFDKLIGQEHIVRILKNQIKNDNVGHAYLFCGARGTGKTSAAKIFARAINCLAPEDGSPCGKCEACLAMREANNMDVIEIDAASNNRVEEVREIRDKVQYPPVSCRYKVYIIDEVHMLSDSAFNALLKTLEEPPRHAVFILATTEPQKLPATILSRCMRFDFKLISEEEISRLVRGIFDDIKLQYDEEAVRLIARSGEGSVRDSLSIADKCVSYCEGKLKYDDVLSVLGSADRGRIIALAESLAKGDVGGVLTKVDELLSLGKNIFVLSRDLASLLKDITVIKSVEGAEKLLALPRERYLELKAIADLRETDSFLRYLELFAEIEQEIRYSLNPRVLFEVTALKCAKSSNDLSYDGLMRRVTALEMEVQRLKSASMQAGTDAPPKKAEKPAVKAESAPTKREIKDGKAVFSELCAAVRSGGNSLLFKILQDVSCEVKNGVLILLPLTEDCSGFLEKEDILDGYRAALSGLGYTPKLKAEKFVKVKKEGDKKLSELSEKLGVDIEIK